MECELRPILSRMLAAIAGIEAAVADKTLEAFAPDWVVRHAAQRGIQIISEAARRLPDTVLLAELSVLWAKINAIGNILRHEYHRIQDKVIWDVIQTDASS